MSSINHTILITGGTGFAGSHLVESLLDQGYDPNQVHVTSFGSRDSFVSQLLPNTNIHALDLSNSVQTCQVFDLVKPSQIYHLAAYSAVGSSFDQLKKVLEVNTTLQLSVLTAIKEVVPRARLLAIGSALEYQSSPDPLIELHPLGPISPYAVSKVTQEMLAYSFSQHSKLDVVRVRPFNHYGERQAPGFVVADFAEQIALMSGNDQEEQNTILVGNLAAIRDLTYVKDIVNGYIILMNQGQTGEVYNLGSGIGVTIEEILRTLILLSGKNIKIEVDQQKFRPVDVPKVIADTSKIKELGWKPTFTLKEGLLKTLRSYQVTSK